MKKTRIVFLVLPHVHLMDLAGPDQVFLEAISYDTPLEIIYCGDEPEPESSAGLPFGKLADFSEVRLEEGDFLFVPGAELKYLQSGAFRSRKTLFEWIRACRAAGVRICSICSGAFVLAESGILNGKSCTTHWKRTGELQRLYPKLNVIENILFTEDDGIYTSAGIASGIDLALHILEQMRGGYVTHKVARELVIYTRRSGDQKQQSELLDFRNHIHTGIHKVQDWLQENLHKRSTLSFLAEMANMSGRNFTRVFKKETSVTVNAYINLLRREKISGLLSSPDLSRGQIAELCGLRSERQIARILNGGK